MHLERTFRSENTTYTGSLNPPQFLLNPILIYNNHIQLNINN